MTQMIEIAVEMIQGMPEENVLYMINILQNLEAMSADREKDGQKVKKFLTGGLIYKGYGAFYVRDNLPV